MLFERKKLLVGLIVQSADMTMVSPHILKLTIELKPPVEGRLVGYLYRRQGVRTKWTDAEKSFMRVKYPTADRADIMQALPGRNWIAIVHQASELRLNRPRIDAQQLTDRLSRSDMQVLEMLHLLGHGLQRGGYVWQIESDINMYYWWAHLDNYNVRNTMVSQEILCL